jgi:acetyl-CoA carboxylase carboxyl transferase subunit beta
MAWFRKEKKPRQSTRERLEIPADAWEKCDACGHIDLREKFERALNVCPECGHHRRFTAEEYIELLTDEGSWRELYGDLRSEDPLGFEHYPDRLKAANKKAGHADAMYAGTGRLDRVPLNLGVMNFAFMGGSMGSVVGEKITGWPGAPLRNAFRSFWSRPRAAPGCRRVSFRSCRWRRPRPRSPSSTSCRSPTSAS